MRSTARESNDKLHAASTAVHDEDYTSSSGSSSSESETENEDSENEDEKMQVDHTTRTTSATVPAASSSSSIPSIPGRPRPAIHRMEGGSDLLSRLSTFLPKMEHANKDLEKEIAAGRGKSMILDEVDDEDEKEYIEMNLGLGVLEEKRGDGATSSSEVESEDDVHGDSGHGRDQSNKKCKKEADSDVLGKLMGSKQSAAEKPSIEEMAE